jgi:hypothetical protein
LSSSSWSGDESLPPFNVDHLDPASSISKRQSGVSDRYQRIEQSADLGLVLDLRKTNRPPVTAGCDRSEQEPNHREDLGLYPRLISVGRPAGEHFLALSATEQ